MHWMNGRAYSQDLRDRVMAAVDAGDPVRGVAKRFEVSAAYVYKALIRRRMTGEVGARTERGRPPRKLTRHEGAIAAFLNANPDATLADVRRHLAERHAVPVSIHAVWSTVRRLGLTLKKSPAGGRAGPARRRQSPQTLADLATFPRS